MTDPIRVLIVDDQELIRVGFRLILDAEPDIAVVGEAADGLEALAVCAAVRPDVVLMDIRMPRLDGIEATRRVVAEHPASRVLVLTTFDLDEYAFGAVQAGASGFLLKDAPRQTLVAAVRAVHRGDAVLAPRATRLLLDAYAEAPVPGGPRMPDGLTDREAEVFVAVGRGLSNGEIAAELFLGESTVKTHVGRLLAKLGARDRIHLVILAHRAGLVR